MKAVRSDEKKGLSRSGNARGRKIMIQLARRLVKFQHISGFLLNDTEPTENAKGSRKPRLPPSSSLPCGAMRMTASYRKASGCIQRRNRQQEGRRNFGTSARIATKRPKNDPR